MSTKLPLTILVLGLSLTLTSAQTSRPYAVSDATENAFGYPMPGTSALDRRGFSVGNALFRDIWIAAPSTTPGRDGVGPFFNARACGSCHFKDGRGLPPEKTGDIEDGLLLRIGVRSKDGADLPHPVYGGQVTDRSLDGVAPEASLVIERKARKGTYADGTEYELMVPHYGLADLGYGPLGEGVVLGPRIAPILPGLGLLESIPDEAILAREDPDDRDGDGISGRAQRLEDGHLGRFGWKATAPTLRHQIAAAFVNDMGLTSDVFPEEALSSTQLEKVIFVPGGNPEVSKAQLDRLELYSRLLAIPERRNVDDPAVVAGEKLFNSIGCAACHVPTWTTTSDAPHPLLSSVEFHPYTDMLLHDLGPALADEKHDGVATPSEWRTAPLWGLGLVQTVNGHERFLHDGRARGFEEAILWHGGEAEKSREAFRHLDAAGRAALIAFLRSL